MITVSGWFTLHDVTRPGHDPDVRVVEDHRGGRHVLVAVDTWIEIKRALTRLEERQPSDSETLTIA